MRRQGLAPAVGARACRAARKSFPMRTAQFFEDAFKFRAAGLVTAWFSSFIGRASCGGTFARVSWRAAPRRSDRLGFWLLASSDVLGGLALRTASTSSTAFRDARML